MLETRTLLTGSFVSSLQIGAGSNDEVLDMFVDSSGNTFLTGYFSAAVDFDPGAGEVILDAGSTDNAIWRSSGDSTPNTADWSGTEFGPATNTAGVGEWRIIDGAESPTRDEKIVIGVRTSGVISGQMYSSGSWSALPFSIASGAATNKHGFDVVYESISGTALLVWTNGSSDVDNVSYRVWSGTSWSAAQTITTPLAGVASEIHLAAARNSDAIVMNVTNSASQDYAIYWNGANWVNGVILGNATVGESPTDSGSGIESNSGEGLVIYDNDNVAGGLEFRTYIAATWSAAGILAAPVGVSADDVVFVTTATDRGSNRIALGVLNAANDIWFGVWDGSSWSSTVVATTSSSTTAALNMSVAFEGESSALIATYGVSGTNTVQYRTWTGGAGWSAELTGPDLGAVPNAMSLTADPISDRIMLAVQDANSDLHYVQWSGEEWESVNTVDTNTGETTVQPFLFLFNASSKTEDAFIAKYDASGALVWAKAFGGGLNDRSNAITVDTAGNIYVTGSYNRGSFSGAGIPANDFDPGPGVVSLPNTSLEEVFVSKFNSDGELIWAKAFSGFNDYEEGLDIAVSLSGAIHVTGVFTGPVDFDPAPPSYYLFPNLLDTFIAKLNSNGSLAWAKSFTGVLFSDDVVANMALDDFGNIYLSGVYSGTVDFDPSPSFATYLSSGFGVDSFLVKLDLSGVLVAARSLGGDYDLEVLGMNVAPNGTVLVSGRFSGEHDLDPGPGNIPLFSNGQSDAFVARFNNALGISWGFGFGGTKDDVANSVVRDAEGNVYVLGDFESEVDFDPSDGELLLESNGSRDVFVLRLNSEIEFSWAKSFGGDQADHGGEIGVDSAGFIYLAGTFRDEVDFDPDAGVTTLDSNGRLDIYRSRWTQDLIFQTTGVGPDDIVVRRNDELIEIYDRNLDTVVEQVRLDQISGIQLKGQAGEQDSFTVDFLYGGTFPTIRPLIFTGTVGDGDIFNYIGTTREVTVYRPSTDLIEASRFTWDGRLYLLFGLEEINITRVSSFRLQTKGNVDNVTVSPAAGFDGVPASRMTGSSDSVPIGSVTVDTLAKLVIDTGEYDVGNTGADSVAFQADSFLAAGLKDIMVTTGAGDDYLSMTDTDLRLPVAGGNFRYRASDGDDQLAVVGDVDWRINDARVSSSGGGLIRFSDLERATLTGGASNNELIAVGFSGKATLFGREGNDTLRGGINDDILIGGEGDDLLVGNGGADQFTFEGTFGDDDIQLQFLTPTSQSYTRRDVGSATILETDTIINDTNDTVSIYALDGNDIISVALAVPLSGFADGGIGADTFNVPGNWTTAN